VYSRFIEQLAERKPRRIFSSVDPHEHKPLTLYDGEQTIPALHYCHDDIDLCARLRYSLGRFGTDLEESLFDDLRTLSRGLTAFTLIG